jgi:hypothetical protein
VGIDQLIEKITTQIGNLEAAYITGDFAQGHDSKIIDLVLVGQNLNIDYIGHLIQKAQEFVDRKIHHLVLTNKQMQNYFKDKPALLIWEAN